MQLVSWIARQTGKISDRFNDYKFYVKQEPEVIDSSSTVCIQAFNSRDMTATIPCIYRWFTVRNGLTTEIPHFKGNTYICQPADVGCLLQVEITSSDPQCTGTAVIAYGPVKFDVLLKKEIQMALSTGESTFILDIGENNYSRQCTLRVQQQRITIHHIPTQTAFTFDYNFIQPKVQVLQKIPTRVRIIFNPKYYDDLQHFLSRLFSRPVSPQQITHHPFIQLNMNNRKARDSFTFIVKAFNTKKHLKATTYASNLQKQLDFTKLTEKQRQKTIDELEHISQLNYDLNKLMQINAKNYMEKRVYLEETKRLQNEMQEIVSEYMKIIEEKFQGREEFEKSFIILKEKEEEMRGHREQRAGKEFGELEHKVRILEEENRELRKALGNAQDEQKEHNGSVVRESVGNNSNDSPFKRKTIFDTLKPQDNNQIQNLQTPSFQPILKPQEDQFQLKKQLHEMSVKYQCALREIQQLKSERVQFPFPQNRKYEQQINLDKFDAKSVKSVNHQNQNNHSHLHMSPPSNTSSSLLISNHSHTINPQRLKFHQSPLKPLSPQSSLQSYPIISQLQHQNTTLKQQLQSLTDQLQELAQKQLKYKKRISQLTEQLDMHKRNNDVLNRSQHLSMEMEEYNESQSKMLKEENEFLKKQIESCQTLCLKYKSELKKYKMDKTMSERSFQMNQQAGV